MPGFPKPHISLLFSHISYIQAGISSRNCVSCGHWILRHHPRHSLHDAWLTVDYRRRADLIQGLVTRGADINLANRQGLTPLHCAAQRVGSPSRSPLLQRSVLALCCLASLCGNLDSSSVVLLLEAYRYSSESERACVRDFSRGVWMFDACCLGCPELYFFLLPHVFLFSSLRPHPILIPHLSSSA